MTPEKFIDKHATMSGWLGYDTRRDNLKEDIRQLLRSYENFTILSGCGNTEQCIDAFIKLKNATPSPKFNFKMQ
jgi:hypothetical protein